MEKIEQCGGRGWLNLQTGITWVQWLPTHLNCHKIEKICFDFTFFIFCKYKNVLCSLFFKLGGGGVYDGYMKTCKLGFFTAGISFVLLYSLIS